MKIIVKIGNGEFHMEHPTKSAAEMIADFIKGNKKISRCSSGIQWKYPGGEWKKY